MWKFVDLRVLFLFSMSKSLDFVEHLRFAILATGQLGVFVLRYLLRDKETKVAMAFFFLMARHDHMMKEVSARLFPHVITILNLFKRSISNFGSYSSFLSNKNIYQSS